jgi:hypothetical protein
MASRSRKSGGSGTIAKVVWFFAVGGLIVWFFAIPYDPGVQGIVGVVQSKAKTVENWVKTNPVIPAFEQWVGSIFKGGSQDPGWSIDPMGPNGQGPGTNTTSQTKEQLILSLNLLMITEPENVSYNRSDYPHWSNIRSCWTVREQVLFDEAQPGTAVLVDSEGRTVTDVNQACEIKGGLWIDPHTGKEFSNPSDLDIDHTIPLAYANAHGASWWDKNKKQSYANDLSYHGTLTAASKSANRTKGADGPSKYKPANEGYWCQYATDWVNISTQWQLSITQADHDALKEMLGKCVN